MEFELRTRIVFGPNSLEQISQEVTNLGCRKALILIDPVIMSSGIVAEMFSNMKRAGIEYKIFDTIEPEPSTSCVEAAYTLLQSGNFEIIVAVGGGSTIDTAKAVAVMATNPGKIQDYAGWNEFTNEPLPIIAVPTTAGTGSEVTDASVITDKAQNLKFTIKHDRYNRPKVAILDPLLLRTVPQKLAVTTGIDALAHAVESYTSLLATKYYEVFSISALELIYKHLRDFARDRGNEQAATGMLLASNMAGISFPVVGTGNCHCIARFVGARYGISHGMCCAIILPHVVEFNCLATPDKFKIVASAFGENVQGLNASEGAKQAVLAIRKLNADLDLPATIREYDPALKVDVELLAEECSKTWYNKYNPRFTTKDDFIELIGKIAG